MFKILSILTFLLILVKIPLNDEKRIIGTWEYYSFEDEDLYINFKKDSISYLTVLQQEKYKDSMESHIFKTLLIRAYSRESILFKKDNIYQETVGNKIALAGKYEIDNKNGVLICPKRGGGFDRFKYHLKKDLLYLEKHTDNFLKVVLIKSKPSPNSD